MARDSKSKIKFKAQSETEPEKKLAKRDKRLLFFVAFGGLITLGIGLALAAYATVNYKYEANYKSSELNENVVFEVPRGSGLSSIATRLEKEELISSAFIFKLVTKIRGNEGNFKAGEFSLNRGDSMSDIYSDLADGKAILYPVTIAEGLSSVQIMTILDNSKTLIDDDPALPVEGSLLPETYMTPRGMKQSDLIRQMQNAQKQTLDTLWNNRAENLPIKSKEEAIILASVVEKETGVGSERHEVAGVFTNRLRKGMKLQSDPTIIYGITKGLPLGRGIRRSEIDRKTEWNTYQIPALPKTAICHPGREALEAVLNPAATENLFFVADGTGGHVFAKTLAGHQRNVRNWRKIERQRKLKFRGNP